MMLFKTRAIFAPKLFLALLCAAAVQLACAQTYPNRPIRVIVAMPRGADQNIMLRKIGEEIAPRIGQPFVIDNRPGGAQIPAMEACKTAVPDRHSDGTATPTGLS